MSNDDPEPNKLAPFPRAQLIFYVIGTVVAAPLAKSGWDAMMAGDYLRGGLSLTAAFVTATGAYSFQYWESHLAEPTRRVIRDLAGNKVLVAAIVLIFAGYSFVVIPDFVRKVELPGSPTNEPSLKSQLDLATQKIASLQSELGEKERELSAAQNAFNKRPSASGSPQILPPNAAKLPPTAEEIATKISIWESVGTVNLNALVNAYNKIDEVFSKWPELIESENGRTQLYQGLVNNTAAYVGASDEIETLRSAYKGFPEVSEALAQPHRNDLAKASSDFSNAIISLEVISRATN